MQLSFSSQSTICWRLVAWPSKLYASRRRLVVASRPDSFFVVPWTISADPAPGCRQALTVRLRGDPPNCMKMFRVKVRIFLPPCRALLLRLGMWLACRAYYACVVRVFIKHTISLYISSFTPLYVYTSIRPIIFFHLPRSAILGTLKQSYSPAAPIGDALIATPSSSLDPCPWHAVTTDNVISITLIRINPSIFQKMSQYKQFIFGKLALVCIGSQSCVLQSLIPVSRDSNGHQSACWKSQCRQLSFQQTDASPWESYWSVSEQ